MHQGVFLALIEEMQILPARLEATFNQGAGLHSPSNAQIFLAVAADASAGEGIDIVGRRGTLLGVIEADHGAA